MVGYDFFNDASCGKDMFSSSSIGPETVLIVVDAASNFIRAGPPIADPERQAYMEDLDRRTSS